MKIGNQGSEILTEFSKVTHQLKTALVSLIPKLVVMLSGTILYVSYHPMEYIIYICNIRNK